MCKFYFVVYPATVLLLFVLLDGDAAISNVTMAVDKNVSIYYDLNANSTFPIESAAAGRLPSQVKFFSSGPPCTCNELKCGCCAGLNMTAIKFRHRACTNFTVVPEEFALDFELLMNDKQVFTNRVSARDPPPACVPLYFLPAVTFCVRFFDLHLADDKLNACIDFETRLVHQPVYILHFHCVKIGGNGVTWVRPKGDVVTPVIANVEHPEAYDDVNFEAPDENDYSHTSTSIPEEEDQIGSLKL